jgi:hypothetical protein
MEDFDDYRWILLDDRGSERAAFSCENDPITDMSECFAGKAVAHTDWQWLSAIEERTAVGIGIQSLPVIQID